MTSSSTKIDAPTEALSQMIWCEIVNDETIRIRCNHCQVKFYEGDYFESVTPGNDWLGTAIRHIAEIHPEMLLTASWMCYSLLAPALGA